MSPFNNRAKELISAFNPSFAIPFIPLCSPSEMTAVPASMYQASAHRLLTMCLGFLRFFALAYYSINAYLAIPFFIV